MSKRRSKRSMLSFSADIISGERSYRGSMENVSERGYASQQSPEMLFKALLRGIW